MTTFTITPRGPFSLAASAAFLEGFTPAAHQDGQHQHLHLAFVADDGKDAGVCLRQPDPAGEVAGEAFGPADPTVVRDQAARILSLDVDGSGFPDVGRRDPVVGRLQARWPGLRPVCFFSPYEAAAWCLISHRIRISQAARVKARMTAALGPVVDVHGDRQHAFPGPARLAELDSFPGLFGRKVEYLRALGDAAQEGLLDAGLLRSQPRQQALAALRELPGIGGFSSELILLRGAGDPDHVPTHEARVCNAIALAYGLEQAPSGDELTALTDPWRPYRTWVCFLLRVLLEEETHEIAGQAAAGRRPVAQA